MEIKDANGVVICIILRSTEIVKKRNFITLESEEMQFASFNYSKGSSVKRHIHNLIERKIMTTSEAIVVLEGKIEVKIYDNSLKFLNKVELYEKDSILMLSGGHEINIRRLKIY
jgi:hypothetical protein